MTEAARHLRPRTLTTLTVGDPRRSLDAGDVDNLTLRGHVLGEACVKEGTPMDDSELDARLRAAAPLLATPSGLADHRARILRDARARRTRRLRVWGASAAASILLVGGGTVAMAAGGHETPWGWVADNVFSIPRTDGTACFQGIQVNWHGLAEDDPIVVDAKAIVSGIDLEALDTTEAEAELRVEYAQATDMNGDPSPITVSDDQLTQAAVHDLVADALWEGLEERGHEMWPEHNVSLASQTTDCR